MSYQTSSPCIWVGSTTAVIIFVFVNFTAAAVLLVIVLACFNFNTGTLGSVKVERDENYVLTCLVTVVLFYFPVLV